jgi:nucleoside-diphosphate-sugar epimerase
MKILITGANGFIGSRLMAGLSKSEHQINGTVRVPFADNPNDTSYITIGTINSDTDWHEALKGQDVVIHTAARVHLMHDGANDALEEYRRINVNSTLNLARQAADLGIRRFIFLSSVKVNGESTPIGHPFSENDIPAPLDPYGISKKEAEDGLFKLSRTTEMEVICIRPTLVYGPGVKANFASMMKWLFKGIPLPLGAIQNKRSMISLSNLVDLIACCITRREAANQVFLASDGEDISTTELCKRLGKALGRPARLIPIPMELLNIGAAIIGKNSIIQRLCGNLQVDITKAKSLLGWKPRLNIDEALKMTADEFIRQNQ